MLAFLFNHADNCSLLSLWLISGTFVTHILCLDSPHQLCSLLWDAAPKAVTYTLLFVSAQNGFIFGIVMKYELLSCVFSCKCQTTSLFLTNRNICTDLILWPEALTVQQQRLSCMWSGLSCLATDAKLCPTGPPASSLQSSYLISDTPTVAESANSVMSVCGCWKSGLYIL